MSEIKGRNLAYIIGEDEPPPKKLISDADMLIKQLVEKQRNTVTTLQEQLAAPKEFTKAVELVPLASYNPGTSSLQHFQQTAQHFDKVEALKAAGLLDEDIQLFFDSLSGDDYLFQKHKNWEKSLLKEQLIAIREKVNRYETTQSIMRNNTEPLQKHELIEYGLSVKPESIETKLLKFALNNQKEKSKPSLPHPMDNIKQIEKSRFTDLGETALPSLNKIRRKARKLLNRIHNVSPNEGTTESDFRGTVQMINTSNEQKNCSLAKESKWDVTEVETKIKDVERKVYTCLPQNYYTIKNGEIVKFSKQEVELKGLQIVRRFSTEEIKKLPKFQNYEPGTPSKILYIKNLSNTVKEDDLKCLFKNYDKEKNVLYRIMKGKMRGQAFVTFPDEKVASQALDEINGIVLKNKPVVIQFGCAKDKQ